MSLPGQAYKKVNLIMQWARHSKLLKTWELEIKTRLGIPVRYNSPARIILETIILPNMASQNQNSEGSRVLFVGCDWYTNHYKKEYFKKWDYWTIDPDITKKRYGSKNHVIGHLELLAKYFGPEYFDLIICNGVVGYGLNQLGDVEEALDSCYTCLRVGGKLMLGREDEPGFIPFSNDDVKSLKRFAPYYFSPLATSNYSLKPRHNYNFSFFEKPAAGNHLKQTPEIGVMPISAVLALQPILQYGK